MESPLEVQQLAEESRSRVPGWAGAQPRLYLIDKGGSDRHYYRVRSGSAQAVPESCILMVYTDRRADNLTFFHATDVLLSRGVRTPEIYAHIPSRKLAWMEDLGGCDLWDCRNYPAAERFPLYKDALRQAAMIHDANTDNLSADQLAHLQPGFHQPLSNANGRWENLYLWEQDYFFTHFVQNFSKLEPDEIAQLRQSHGLREMARGLASKAGSLIHRDLQSQNVIVRDGQAWLIDYQGLRLGRPEYDLASLLYDPYVGFTEDEREELLAYYYAHRFGSGDWAGHRQTFAWCACQRLMQALGAYGFLGLAKGKRAFLSHIPGAVGNLRQILRKYDLLPELELALNLRDFAFGLEPALS